MFLICGIDPGLDGALAFLDEATLRIDAIIGMPAMKLGKGKGAKREISARMLKIEIDREIISLGLIVRCVYMERVQSSPQMGVASAFKFGRGYGTVEGVIAALGWPIEYVTPPKWKKAMGVPAEKDDARERANQLLAPDADLWTPKRLVMTTEQASGRAEAALIALYGARDLAGFWGARKSLPADLFAEAV
jgi:hypothetical protein